MSTVGVMINVVANGDAILIGGATSGEAKYCNDSSLVVVLSSNAGIVDAWGCNTGSRDAALGKVIIDDATSGHTASHPVTFGNAAPGDASVGGVTSHQATSISAATILHRALTFSPFDRNSLRQRRSCQRS
ncbi:hypothetical protein QAD02_023605 [Eretmocerus hayati]|uniref:Uncharacterized protein n=1 Tax=Eretmocerus hayati TaxID=131215 RepID=A0ACC2PY01_9HYME|nr:hypothetical protein QAD02_023605 [Eretmocerus hayati]